MSDILSIKAAERCDMGTANARRIRREGLVPVVVYSHGSDAVALTVSAADAQLAIHHPSLLEMVDEASGAKHTAVVKDFQIHPLNGKILHIDFLAVKADEIIESTVELEGTGEAAGTRAGGQLEQVLHELVIKSKPLDVPEKIIVDVSSIELDQALHVKDLVLPAGVEAVSDPELIVFHVRTVKAEAEPEAAEGEAAAAAEPEKK